MSINCLPHLVCSYLGTCYCFIYVWKIKGVRRGWEVGSSTTSSCILYICMLFNNETALIIRKGWYLCISKLNLVREAFLFQNGWIYGSFQNRKLHCRFSYILRSAKTGEFRKVIPKKFPQRGRRDKNFQKIHLFWNGKSSLSPWRSSGSFAVSRRLKDGANYYRIWQNCDKMCQPPTLPTPLWSQG